MITLGDLERDALAELANIGVSRAAASLRKMVGHQVLLSVPAVDVLTSGEATQLVSQRQATSMIAVEQTISGAFVGRCLLIFPDEGGKSLVEILVGETMGREELEAFQDEALGETGNILLNACFGAIANMLQQRVQFSTPKVIRDGRALFDQPSNPAEGVVLFLYVNFRIDGRNISGYIAMVMDLPSLEILLAITREFIQRVVDDGP